MHLLHEHIEWSFNALLQESGRVQLSAYPADASFSD
jgi:hypothetical protein